jgi:hypothetical protein
MDTNDTDAMIKLLDKAMSSNIEEVKSMLQSLLVTTALVHAEDKMALGPLAKILEEFNLMKKKMADMSNHISRLESKLDEIRNPASIYPTKRDPYDGYTTKWQDQDTWEQTIKKRVKDRSMLRSKLSSSMVNDMDDEHDISTYSAIKDVMLKFASRLK